MSDDPVRGDVAEVAAMARELLEWEQVLGPAGVELVESAAGSAPDSAFDRPRDAGGGPLSAGPPVPAPSGRKGARAPRESTDRPARPASDPEARGSAADVLPPAPTAAAPPEERAGRLVTLAEEVAGCTGCVLHGARHQTVFSRGNPDAELVFVGEGPGHHEDQQGLPFVGRAGELLDKMVAAMGYGRDDVYVCNVVKCRPPENRTPLPDEAGACMPFLVQQIQLVAPRVIVALGRCAAEHLGCLDAGARGWRGRWSAWEGIPVMATYHPAFLLRSPNMKRPVWEDLQQVMARLGRAS